MLAEYGILPEVFLAESGESEKLLRLRMNALKREFLDEQQGLVRDPCGKWCDELSRLWKSNGLDSAGKEVAKKLIKRCLHSVGQGTADPPESTRDWVCLFEASYSLEEFEALLANSRINENTQMPVVALDQEAGRPLPGSYQSVRLRRCLEDYAKHLRRLFAVTKELVFIDPYLSCEDNYSDFPKLLENISHRNDLRIELHRQAKLNNNFKVPGQQEWEKCFIELGKQLQGQGLSAKVFIWDQFHDRYLLSSFGGINMPYGFDTTRDPDKDAPTTWTRLSRTSFDSVRKEFAENSPYHKLQHKFEIGA